MHFPVAGRLTSGTTVGPSLLATSTSPLLYRLPVLLRGAIVHLTDLHIDGRDANGLLEEGQVAQQRLALLSVGHEEEPFFSVPLPRRLREHVTGFSHEAWGALEAGLGLLVRSLLDESSEADVAVVQTGDFSMFGATGQGDYGEAAYPQYGALRILQETVLQTTGGSDDEGRFGWVNLFGNHDIWPGTLPRRPPWAGGRRGPIETVPLVSSGTGWFGRNMQIAPINTVRANWWRGELFATGEVGDWPTDTAAYSAVDHWSGGAVRVVVAHHPVIPVRPLRGLWAGWKLPDVTNWVAHAPAAIAHLRSAGAELILAGHLHELLPVNGLGELLDPVNQPMPQQYVSPSPSKMRGEDIVDPEAPAFVVYRIYDRSESEWLLTRTVHRFLTDLQNGPHFAPGREQLMLPAWIRQ
jgi:hypothetical protein